MDKSTLIGDNMKVSYRLGKRSVSFTPKSYIESVYLFGSYVSGNNRPDSDIDHLIIIDDNYDFKWRSVEKAMAKELGIPKDWITTYTKKEFKRRCEMGDYFFWAVKLYSKKIYARTGFTEKVFKSMPVFRDVSESMDGARKYMDRVINGYKDNVIDADRLKSQVAHVYRNAFINLLYLRGYVEFDKFKSAKKCFELEGDRIGFKSKYYYKLYENDYLLSYNDLRRLYDDYIVFHRYIMSVEKRVMKRGFRSPLRPYLG